MNKDDQTIITKVSQQIAKTFLHHEENLAARATLVDADISEITRQIGLETTKIVVEHVRADLVKKNNTTVSSSKIVQSSASIAFSGQENSGLHMYGSPMLAQNP